MQHKNLIYAVVPFEVTDFIRNTAVTSWTLFFEAWISYFEKFLEFWKYLSQHFFFCWPFSTVIVLSRNLWESAENDAIAKQNLKGIFVRLEWISNSLEEILSF